MNELAVVSTEGGDMFVMDNVATGADATNGGGGVFMNPNSTLTMIGVMVEGNSATGASGSGGGVFLSDNVQATITDGTVSGNAANRAGGGIEIANDAMNDGVASLTLDGVEVDENAIDAANPGNGGGIHSGGGALVIMGGSVSGNTAYSSTGTQLATQTAAEDAEARLMRMLAESLVARLFVEPGLQGA